MTNSKYSVKIANIGLFMLTGLYPIGLAVLGISAKTPKARICVFDQAPKHRCDKQGEVKNKPAISDDTVDRNSLRYRLLLK